MANYTTAAKVAALIGVTASEILADWLDYADAEVELRTGKKFAVTTVVGELYDGSGREELILNVYPVISIVKLEYLVEQTPIEVWAELSSTYFRLYGPEGIIRLVDDLTGLCDISSFERGVQNWKVGYTYGSTAVPKIVEFLASLLVAEMYYKSTGESSVIASEKIGDYSISYSTGEETVTSIPKLIDMIVSQLKNTDFKIVGL
jgi:hypothetical protein